MNTILISEYPSQIFEVCCVERGPTCYDCALHSERDVCSYI